MKKIFIGLTIFTILIIVLVSLIYGMCAYTAFDVNPANWTPTVRFISVFLFFIGMIFSIVVSCASAHW
jgi:hypothetical protein